MRKVEPLKLANSEQKSYSYFQHARWHGKRICPRCKYRYLYYLTDRYSCKRCRYNFGEFIDTYLGMLRIPTNIIALYCTPLKLDNFEQFLRYSFMHIRLERDMLKEMLV